MIGNGKLYESVFEISKKIYKFYFSKSIYLAIFKYLPLIFIQYRFFCNLMFCYINFGRRPQHQYGNLLCVWFSRSITLYLFVLLFTPYPASYIKILYVKIHIFMNLNTVTQFFLIHQNLFFKYRFLNLYFTLFKIGNY